MPADFQIVSGTHKTLVPSADDGATPPNPVAFPAGTVFGWSASDPTAVLFSAQDVASPDVTGGTPTDPATPVTITMSVMENGFTHTKQHTVDVLPPAAPDTIGNVDFTLQ